jgi:hypothetical protein
MTAGTARPGRPAEEPAPLQLAERLPEADIGRMEVLLELLATDTYNGRADLPKLGEDTELTDDELLPLAQALSLLQLARIADGDLHLTPLGQRYVDGDHTLRQELFGQQLLGHVPLAAHIRHSLEQEPSGELAEEPFLRLLSESLAADEAERVLRTAIEWGRYGEVFEYDYNTGVIHLPAGDAQAERLQRIRRALQVLQFAMHLAHELVEMQPGLARQGHRLEETIHQEALAPAHAAMHVHAARDRRPQDQLGHGVAAPGLVGGPFGLAALQRVNGPPLCGVGGVAPLCQGVFEEFADGHLHSDRSSARPPALQPGPGRQPGPRN